MNIWSSSTISSGCGSSKKQSPIEAELEKDEISKFNKEIKNSKEIPTFESFKLSQLLFERIKNQIGN